MLRTTATALLLAAGFALSIPAVADESAKEQLEDAAQSSEDATNAQTDEEAREDAGGQFDTDSNSAPVDLRDCAPNCEVDPCDLAPEKCKDQGGPIESE